jgi:N-acetylglucosamine kinase-like BadF-type ATPase
MVKKAYGGFMKIGFDIGGSKTKVLVFDGEWHSHTIVGSFGTATDSDEIIDALKQGIENLDLDGAPEKIIVNLGGKNKGQIKNTIFSVFPSADIEIYRESEGNIALGMMSAFSSDIVVMAGTGTIAFGDGGNGERCIIDGWGQDIGDRGSGYYLGMAAIQSTHQELDSDGEELSATARLVSGRDRPLRFTEMQQYTAARDAVRAVLPKTRGDIAALARRVVDLAREGCPVARELVRGIGRELAETVIMTANKIGSKTPSVVINGGVTKFFDLWVDEFKRVCGASITVEALHITNEGIENALKYMLGEKQ